MHMLYIMGVLLESMKLGFNFIQFLSTFRDRYMYLPKHFKAPKSGKRNAFRSKISVKNYIQSEYPDIDINQFFASFSWIIPSKQSPSTKDIDFDSDMKERTTSSGIELQSLLATNLFSAMLCDICWIFVETVVVSFAVKLPVRTMMGKVTLNVKQQ
ncbi:hypothetical protein MTR67_040352 [Solanum verrucosum]|uniref:DUF7081 domain-containing protein n=1 Tax=Solanum verrucosum TaxID=315347 RepID=A0AAF0ZPC7_SOLVR|nr:hypothetical protein MTR67_040352 [Solanum verrucosum]